MKIVIIGKSDLQKFITKVSHSSMTLHIFISFSFLRIDQDSEFKHQTMAILYTLCETDIINFIGNLPNTIDSGYFYNITSMRFDVLLNLYYIFTQQSRHREIISTIGQNYQWRQL